MIKNPHRLSTEPSDHAQECLAISSGPSSVISLLEPSPWAAHLVEDFWRPLGCHMFFSSFNDFTILSTVFVRHCGENNRIYSLSQFSSRCTSVVSILRSLNCSIGDEFFIIFLPQSWKQSVGQGGEEGRMAECNFFRQQKIWKLPITIILEKYTKVNNYSMPLNELNILVQSLISYQKIWLREIPNFM